MIQGLDGLESVRAPAGIFDRVRADGAGGLARWRLAGAASERVMSQLRGKRALESAQTEASLAARARAGDAGALERLAGAHPDRLFAVLLRLPGDRSEAQDAARDILLSPQPSSSAAPSSISQEQGRRQAQQRQASRPQIRRPVSSSQ